MLVQKLRRVFARRDLPEGVTACNRYVRAEDVLHGRDLRAGRGLQQHLPGKVHQHEGEDGFGLVQLQHGLLRGFLRGGLAGGAASHQQVGVQPVADGGVHAETAVRFDAQGRAHDQLLALLHAEGIQPRQIIQGRKGPITRGIAEDLRVRLGGGTPVQRAQPEAARTRHAQLTPDRVPAVREADPDFRRAAQDRGGQPARPGLRSGDLVVAPGLQVAARKSAHAACGFARQAVT